MTEEAMTGELKEDDQRNTAGPNRPRIFEFLHLHPFWQQRLFSTNGRTKCAHVLPPISQPLSKIRLLYVLARFKFHLPLPILIALIRLH
jgi:hypothetical protein